MLYRKVQSAVYRQCTNFVKNSQLLKSTKPSTEMATWQNEKQHYLTMDIEEKRGNYKDYIKWQDIHTWKQYGKMNKLAKKIDPLPNQQIDISKNELLAEKISILLGDITRLEIDAIVNAANETLLGGGGVDGAIHRAAGPFLKDECSSLNGCKTGEAKITGGYKLPANYVIHTVGPRGEKPELLSNCYNNSMTVLFNNNLRSVAFPCISTGIYGYPLQPAAHVATYAVRKQLEQHPDKIDRVVFCLFTNEDKEIYEGILQTYFPLD